MKMAQDLELTLLLQHTADNDNEDMAQDLGLTQPLWQWRRPKTWGWHNHCVNEDGTIHVPSPTTTTQSNMTMKRHKTWGWQPLWQWRWHETGVDTITTHCWQWQWKGTRPGVDTTTVTMKMAWDWSWHYYNTVVTMTMKKAQDLHGVDTTHRNNKLLNIPLRQWRGGMRPIGLTLQHTAEHSTVTMKRWHETYRVDTTTHRWTFHCDNEDGMRPRGVFIHVCPPVEQI